MPDDVSARLGGPRPRAILIAATIALALLLILMPEVDWPHAVVALALIAGLALVLGVGVRPASLSPLAAVERPQVSSDLRIDGVVAALRDPAVMVDPRGTVRSHNASALGLIPSLKRGEPIMLALRAPDVIEATRAVVATGLPQSVDYNVRVPVARWFRAEVSPVRVTPRGRDEQTPDYILVLFRDLTEERRLERLRADFVANASHELRTPLASVIGFIETIQGPAKQDVIARDRFLTIMLAQAQRMSRLIDDLLSLSRVELNEHVRPQDAVDLVPLLGHVRDTLQPFAQDEGVEVQVEARVETLIIAGDRDEIIRLFENLVQNAIKYGAEGKVVSITLDREVRPGRLDDAVVAVRDQGPGIAAEDIPRLTERFYRVDVAASREKGGTGLGLALVKHILNRHQGRLAIESEKGQGAVFTVRIPVKDDARPVS